MLLGEEESISKIKRKIGTSIFDQVIVWMLLLTEVPHLGRVQGSGQGFDEKKERTATGGFGRSSSAFPIQQTGEEGDNVGTELLRGRSPLCGQRESVVGKTNFDVDTQSV